MNLDIVPKTKFQFDLLSGGSDGNCYMHEVKLKLTGDITADASSPQTSPNDLNLRRRHFSFSTQQSREEDVEENLGGDENPRRSPIGSQASPKAAPQAAGPSASAQSARRDSKGRASSPSHNEAKPNVTVPEYSFEFKFIRSFQTDFTNNDPYQKLIKYSPSANLIFSAGTDGTIRFWSFREKEIEMIKDECVHGTEVDDMDIHPAGTHLVSISRDGRNHVWSTFKADQVATLVHDQAIPAHNDPKNGIVNNVKYVAKKCRYGTVEGTC